MRGTYLKFYVQEKRKHEHILLYEWILERAKALGVQGGSAFRAIAGFGRHGTLHEEHFFVTKGSGVVDAPSLGAIAVDGVVLGGLVRVGTGCGRF